MPRARPTTYAAITTHMLDTLPARIQARRKKHQLTLRQAEAESGVSKDVLARVEEGRDTSRRNLVKIFDWLDQPPNTT